ncbi:alpha/beta fold hydrolase [Actinomyces slackii]|uniref:Beta-ketoacyl-acyl-carrier-protein synthase I n=1 Tax=Actinomyces slackii TaxID=52774 RepID=A0A3S4ULN8_9ACTO|nr:alpha/beta fold hydrolase [Actinomyces slackii]VEG73478.1 Beta-ketoacyl-acyl-carrier-protein synthase I [Actinomyces slackii]
MQAFVLEKYGAPFKEVLMPRPKPGPGQVLVRVAAAGVNHADERSRAGEFKALFRPRLPVVAGGELSGEVVALGRGVSGFSAGQPVIAYTGAIRMGAWAEYVVVDQDALAPAPTTVPLVDAAALPVVGLTAWQALVTLGRITAGKRVLIHGGTGGVGSVAIQLAKHLGAEVATTVSASNADFARSLGADEVIDYRGEDFVSRLAGSPVDLVLDTQGGDTTMRSLEVLRPGGLVVGIAATPDPAMADQAGAPLPIKLALAAMSARLRRRAARLGVRYRFLFIEPDGAALTTLAGLVDEGVLKPVVDRVLPFAQTRQALQQVLAGGARGKVLVSTRPDAVTTEAAHAAADAPSSRPGQAGDNAGEQRPTTWSETPNSRLAVGGEHLVYRDLGPLGGTPVILLTHLGAPLDEWDPAVVNALAANHRVVALELTGMGSSTGTVPGTIQEMAGTARAMIASLGFEQVDLLGFSLGGFIAQQIALDDPALVRRLVLAGTGPAGGRGIDRVTGGAYVYWDMLRGALHRTDAKEFLFFPRTPAGRAAAKDYLARIKERVMARNRPTTLGRLNRQLAAVRRWGSQEPQDLSRITAPTLIANGDHDRMIPSGLSEDMHRRIPGSTLVIYPDSGHGAVFQHHEDFTRILLDHLEA